MSSTPSVLLHHDGELADVKALLRELGTGHHEQTGPASWGESAPAWDVVIATPRRILAFQPPRSGRRPILIAISDGDSRTMRVQMKRMSVDLMVRRPVHPAALRLLLLHTLYRGPERRKRERVSVGGEVRYKTGWIARAGILAELSNRGAQLLGRSKVREHRRIRIQIPGAVTGERPLRVEGTVRRCSVDPTDPHGAVRLAVHFGELSSEQRRRLEATVARYRSGPAALPKEATGGGPRSAPRHHDVATRFSFVAESGDTIHPRQSPSAAEEAPKDRRTRARHAYERRVVALGEEATRVLLGRDLSLGGMRVDPHEELRVGDGFRLALHAATRAEPLVVHATVRRDDGERGLVMTFDALSEAETAELTSLLEQLPTVEAEWNGEHEESLVIGEIVEPAATGER